MRSVDGASTPAGKLEDLAAGDTVGRYEIVGLLGAGGMGRVHRARDPHLDREVAIKVLHRGAGTDGVELQRRLLREAQAMARLNHPNLATVHDVGTVGGEVFIAFELIEGMTLRRWMGEAGRTVGERLGALAAAGRGLAAAHSAGVIHRDFKPDNVLVGRDGAVKVIDFGLARSLGSTTEAPARAHADAPDIDLTLTGSVLGTPAYMAPEQHHGDETDARADQFGFAVCAWEALAGVRPFRGKTVLLIAAEICAGVIEDPAPGTIPAPIAAVLRRALSVAPADRFADMNTLLAALQPVPARRRWPWVVAGLVAAGGLAGLAVVRRPGPTPTRSRSTMPSDALRKVVAANIDTLNGCYERALLDHPGISGVVNIRFEIAETGDVLSTAIDDDGFHGVGGVARCVAKASLDWVFPPPEGGGRVEVTWPFTFQSIEGAE